MIVKSSRTFGCCSSVDVVWVWVTHMTPLWPGSTVSTPGPAWSRSTSRATLAAILAVQLPGYQSATRVQYSTVQYSTSLPHVWLLAPRVPRVLLTDQPVVGLVERVPGDQQPVVAVVEGDGAGGVAWHRYKYHIINRAGNEGPWTMDP